MPPNKRIGTRDIKNSGYDKTTQRHARLQGTLCDPTHDIEILGTKSGANKKRCGYRTNSGRKAVEHNIDIDHGLTAALSQNGCGKRNGKGRESKSGCLERSDTVCSMPSKILPAPPNREDRAMTLEAKVGP